MVEKIRTVFAPKGEGRDLLRRGLKKLSGMIVTFCIMMGFGIPQMYVYVDPRFIYTFSHEKKIINK